MKRGSVVIGGLLGLVVGWFLAVEFGVRSVEAQQPAAPAAATRFAVSAYAGAASTNFYHGCYIIDTATGETWHISLGGQPQKVNGPVR